MFKFSILGANRVQRGLADEPEENRDSQSSAIDVYDFPTIFMRILAKVASKQVVQLGLDSWSSSNSIFAAYKKFQESLSNSTCEYPH